MSSDNLQAGNPGRDTSSDLEDVASSVHIEFYAELTVCSTEHHHVCTARMIHHPIRALLRQYTPLSQLRVVDLVITSPSCPNVTKQRAGSVLRENFNTHSEESSTLTTTCLRGSEHDIAWLD